MTKLPFVPSFGDEVSVWMDAPPAEVWDLVSDVTRIGEFSPETFEAKWTRGSTGPEVGAYFAGHVKRNGVGPTYWSPVITATGTPCCWATSALRPASPVTIALRRTSAIARGL